MSQAALMSFLEAAARDPDLVAELEAATAGKQGPEAAEAIAGCARGRGFEVGNEEVAALARQAAESLDADGELSDTELAGVSGGNWAKEVLRWATLGGP